MYVEIFYDKSVKKLIEDKTRLGPGCYDVPDKAHSKSPKVIQWSFSKTERQDLARKST